MVPERSERRKRTQKIRSRRVLSRAAKRARNRKCRVGRGVLRGKPKIASMSNGRIRNSDVPVAIRSVNFWVAKNPH